MACACYKKTIYIVYRQIVCVNKFTTTKPDCLLYFYIRRVIPIPYHEGKIQDNNGFNYNLSYHGWYLLCKHLCDQNRCFSLFTYGYTRRTESRDAYLKSTEWTSSHKHGNIHCHSSRQAFSWLIFLLPVYFLFAFNRLKIIEYFKQILSFPLWDRNCGSVFHDDIAPITFVEAINVIDVDEVGFMSAQKAVTIQ